LVAYEAGVLVLGGPHPETVRNGADHWLRTQLISLGVPYSWVPPAVLALGFAFWCWARRADRPGDLVGVLSGMVIESVTFALALAAVASATLFSSAHHWGPHGQAYSNYLFLFRLVAGLYFALLYHARGFGIAVGAHACYNVMVSVGAS